MSGEAAVADRTELTADRRAVLNRLKRAQGQLAAVIVSLEDGARCREVITQLSAVSGALDRATAQLVSNAMQRCIASPDKPEDGMTLVELERLLQKLI
jgi:DNA-binding FrmR family transcriptional regulator